MEGPLFDACARPSFDAKVFTRSYCRGKSKGELRNDRKMFIQQHKLVSEQKEAYIFAQHDNLVQATYQVEALEVDIRAMRELLGNSTTTLKTLKDMSERASNITTSHTNQLPTSQISRVGASTSPSHASSSFTNVEYAQAKFGVAHEQYQWILRSVDDLEVFLYEKRYVDAVLLIQRIDKLNLDVQGRILALDSGSLVPQEHPALTQQVYIVLKQMMPSIEEKSTQLVELLRMELLVSDVLGVASLEAMPDATENQARAPSAAGEGLLKHPVTLLMRLGQSSLASSTFLQRRTLYVEQICTEMVVDRAMSDPETCLMEFSQKIFRVILETYKEFLILFSSSGDALGRRQSMSSTGSTRESTEREVSAVLPRLMIWVSDAIRQYCTYFVRLTISGYHAKQNLHTPSGDPAVDDGMAFDMSEIKDETLDSSNLVNQLFAQDTVVRMLPQEWSVLGACLKWTMQLCRRLEKDFLSLGFCVANELTGPLQSCVEFEFLHVEHELKLMLKQEKWEQSQLRIGVRERQQSEAASKQLSAQESSATNASADGVLVRKLVNVTSSVHHLYDTMQLAMKNIRKVLSPHYVTTEFLQDCAVNSVISVVRMYVEYVVHVAGAYDIDTYIEVGRLKPIFPTMSQSERSRMSTFEDLVRYCITYGEQYPSICAILEKVLRRPLETNERRVVTVICSRPFSTKQYLAQIANCICIGNDLVSRLQATMEKAIKGKILAFDTFRDDVAHLGAKKPSYVTRLIKCCARRVVFEVTEAVKLEDTKQEQQEEFEVQVKQLKEEIDEALDGKYKSLFWEIACSYFVQEGLQMPIGML